MWDSSRLLLELGWTIQSGGSGETMFMVYFRRKNSVPNLSQSQK